MSVMDAMLTALMRSYAYVRIYIHLYGITWFRVIASSICIYVKCLTFILKLGSRYPDMKAKNLVLGNIYPTFILHSLDLHMTFT